MGVSWRRAVKFRGDGGCLEGGRGTGGVFGGVDLSRIGGWNREAWPSGVAVGNGGVDM